MANEQRIAALLCASRPANSLGPPEHGIEAQRTAIETFATA